MRTTLCHLEPEAHLPPGADVSTFLSPSLAGRGLALNADTQCGGSAHVHRGRDVTMLLRQRLRIRHVRLLHLGLLRSQKRRQTTRQSFQLIRSYVRHAVVPPLDMSSAVCSNVTLARRMQLDEPDHQPFRLVTCASKTDLTDGTLVICFTSAPSAPISLPCLA